MKTVFSKEENEYLSNSNVYRHELTCQDGVIQLDLNRLPHLKNPGYLLTINKKAIGAVIQWKDTLKIQIHSSHDLSTIRLTGQLAHKRFLLKTDGDIHLEDCLANENSAVHVITSKNVHIHQSVRLQSLSISAANVENEANIGCDIAAVNTNLFVNNKQFTVKEKLVLKTKTIKNNDRMEWPSLLNIQTDKLYCKGVIQCIQSNNGESISLIELIKTKQALNSISLLLVMMGLNEETLNVCNYHDVLTRCIQVTEFIALAPDSSFSIKDFYINAPQIYSGGQLTLENGWVTSKLLNLDAGKGEVKASLINADDFNQGYKNQLKLQSASEMRVEKEANCYGKTKVLDGSHLMNDEHYLMDGAQLKVDNSSCVSNETHAAPCSSIKTDNSALLKHKRAYFHGTAILKKSNLFIGSLNNSGDLVLKSSNLKSKNQLSNTGRIFSGQIPDRLVTVSLQTKKSREPQKPDSISIYKSKDSYWAKVRIGENSTMELKINQIPEYKQLALDKLPWSDKKQILNNKNEHIHRIIQTLMFYCDKSTIVSDNILSFGDHDIQHTDIHGEKICHLGGEKGRIRNSFIRSPITSLSSEKTSLEKNVVDTNNGSLTVNSRVFNDSGSRFTTRGFSLGSCEHFFNGSSVKSTGYMYADKENKIHGSKSHFQTRLGVFGDIQLNNYTSMLADTLSLTNSSSLENYSRIQSSSIHYSGRCHDVDKTSSVDSTAVNVKEGFLTYQPGGQYKADRFLVGKKGRFSYKANPEEIQPPIDFKQIINLGSFEGKYGTVKAERFWNAGFLSTKKSFVDSKEEFVSYGTFKPNNSVYKSKYIDVLNGMHATDSFLEGEKHINIWDGDNNIDGELKLKSDHSMYFGNQSYTTGKNLLVKANRFFGNGRIDMRKSFAANTKRFYYSNSISGGKKTYIDSNLLLNLRKGEIRGKNTEIHTFANLDCGASIKGSNSLKMNNMFQFNMGSSYHAPHQLKHHSLFYFHNGLNLPTLPSNMVSLLQQSWKKILGLNLADAALPEYSMGIRAAYAAYEIGTDLIDIERMLSNNNLEDVHSYYKKPSHWAPVLSKGYAFFNNVYRVHKACSFDNFSYPKWERDQSWSFADPEKYTESIINAIAQSTLRLYYTMHRTYQSGKALSIAAFNAYAAALGIPLAYAAHWYFQDYSARDYVVRELLKELKNNTDVLLNSSLSKKISEVIQERYYNVNLVDPSSVLHKRPVEMNAGIKAPLYDINSTFEANQPDRWVSPHSVYRLMEFVTHCSDNNNPSIPQRVLQTQNGLPFIMQSHWNDNLFEENELMDYVSNNNESLLSSQTGITAAKQTVISDCLNTSGCLGSYWQKKPSQEISKSMVIATPDNLLQSKKLQNSPEKTNDLALGTTHSDKIDTISWLKDYWKQELQENNKLLDRSSSLVSIHSSPSSERRIVAKRFSFFNHPKEIKRKTVYSLSDFKMPEMDKKTKQNLLNCLKTNGKVNLYIKLKPGKTAYVTLTFDSITLHEFFSHEPGLFNSKKIMHANKSDVAQRSNVHNKPLAGQFFFKRVKELQPKNENRDTKKPENPSTGEHSLIRC